MGIMTDTETAQQTIPNEVVKNIDTSEPPTISTEDLSSSKDSIDTGSDNQDENSKELRNELELL